MRDESGDRENCDQFSPANSCVLGDVSKNDRAWNTRSRDAWPDPQPDSEQSGNHSNAPPSRLPIAPGHIHLVQLPLTASETRCRQIDGAAGPLSGSGPAGPNGVIPSCRREQGVGLQSCQSLQAELHWWTFPECRLYWPKAASVRHTEANFALNTNRFICACEPTFTRLGRTNDRSISSPQDSHQSTRLPRGWRRRNSHSPPRPAVRKEDQAKPRQR
jgi:hypothetical protein